MEEMEKLLKKQLLFTRIFAVSNIVLVLIVLFVVLKVVPGITFTMNRISEALTQATVTLEIAEDTLNQASEALDDFDSVAGNVNDLVDSSSVAVEQAMNKVNQMDIEKLNQAIADLSDVVEPLASFFNKFNR